MINDQNFIKIPDVPGPTKEEIRCLVICKSSVKSEDVVVDIGCGTGGLTVEFAKRAKTVYSIDLNHNYDLYHLILLLSFRLLLV